MLIIYWIVLFCTFDYHVWKSYRQKQEYRHFTSYLFSTQKKFTIKKMCSITKLSYYFVPKQTIKVIFFFSKKNIFIFFFFRLTGKKKIWKFLESSEWVKCNLVPGKKKIRWFWFIAGKIDLVIIIFKSMLEIKQVSS